MCYATSIKLYKIYYVLKKGRPIWTVFLLYLTITKKLNVFEAMLLNSISNIIASLLEVPSGYLAEIIGYKKIVFCGEVCSFIGFAIIYFSNHFYVLVIAYILGGVSEALISGTDEALIYSYFKLSNNEDNYKSFISELFSKSEFIAAIITLSSGYLFKYKNTLPMLVSVIMMIIGIIIFSLLEEVPLEKNMEIKDFRLNFREASNLKSILKIFIISYTIFFLTVSNINYTVSTYLQSLNFNVVYIGVLLFILKTLTSLGAWINSKYDFNLKTSLVVYYILIFILSLGDSIILVIIILGILRLMNGIIFPTLKTNINKNITENRAFILSFQSLVVSISSTLFDPLYGKSIDLFGYMTTYKFIILFFLAIVVVIYIQKHKENNRSD